MMLGAPISFKACSLSKEYWGFQGMRRVMQKFTLQQVVVHGWFDKFFGMEIQGSCK